MKFSICVMEPEGYRHTHFLYDICKYLCFGIESAGYECCILRNKLTADRTNIIVGAHNLNDPAIVNEIKQRGNYILLLTEIITGNSINNCPVQKSFADILLPLMRQSRVVWTGGEANGDALKKLGVEVDLISGLGYHPLMEEIHHKHNKDIDFLFCGSITPHRKKLLDQLIARGGKVVTIFDDAAMYRNDLIARTRVNLAPNQGPGMNQFGGSRVLYLINNKSIVVVERCRDQAMYEHCFPWADTEQWVDLCMETLRRPDLDQITEEYYERFKKIRMVDMIEPLLDKFLSKYPSHASGDKKIQTDQLPTPGVALGENLLSTRFKEREVTSGLTSVVIPTSNQLDYTKRCVKSIHRHTPEAHEIIFIDNGCRGAMLKWIRQTVKGKSNYRLIKVGKEAGLGKCFNKGMEASSGEYILLMRDHVIVADGWLTGMLECHNNANDSGIVGPMTNAKAAGRQYVADSVHVEIDQLEEYAKAFHERNRHRRVSSQGITGFCMLFRRSLVEEIGPFDEELEHGSESDDYCLRAQIEGYQNLIVGDVFVLCGLLPPKGNKRFFDYKWRDIDAKSHNGERVGVLNAITDAEKLYQREEVDKAIVTLIDGIKYRPNEEGIYHRLAEMLIDCERFKEGLDAINSIHEDKRDSARTVELTGYCKAGLEMYDEAAEWADRALSLNGSSAPALNLMGVLAHIRGDKGASEDFFKRAIASDPGYGEAYTNLGILVWEAGRKEEALEILEKGFILSPTAEDNRTAYLSAISETAEFERAEGIFREAKALYPQNRRIAFLLIDILIRQEKYDSAMQDIREAMITFGINDGILSAAQAVLDRFDAQETKDVQEKPTLSLCMIVKDEEDCLARCLMSVMPVVDEIIIVDTGSTDSTKAIAKAFGARVYDFEWTSDFSEARNLSLSKATGNWILVLDADEVISPLDYDRLSRIVKNDDGPPKAYSITTRNYVKPPHIIGWTCNKGEYPDEEDGTGWYPSAKVRLFTNDGRIRFENLIHELVESSLNRNGIEIRENDIPVHHYGPLDRENYVAKGEKYYRLGKKKLEGKGEDPMALTELAVQAGGEFGKYEEAVDLWKRVLKIDPHNVKALVNMGGNLLKLENYEAARTSSKMAMTLSPDLKESVIIYTTCEVLIGDVGKAIPILESLLKEVPEYPLALAILVAAYGIEGERKKGMEQIRNISKMGFKSADYLQDMAERLISTGNTDRAVSLLEFAVESGKGTREIRELLDGLMIG